MLWDVRIPMRDGICLSATAYLPVHQPRPRPAIFTLTPYIAQTWHDRGVYFASRGYPFLSVDVRGRGNSEGDFHPFSPEGRDGHDIVEWLAGQSYCDGKVAMWGGSYAGWDQWGTAGELPPHLATIVPVASPYIGVDIPIRSNLIEPYWIQWLCLVAGRTSQDKLFFGDEPFWAAQFRRWFESGTSLQGIDAFLGLPSRSFQEWLAHPHQDAYWDGSNPSAAQYADISIPVLTITGAYDSDQAGALTHYAVHLKNTSAAGREGHFLVIGPWDHAGTRTPQPSVCGLDLGPDSLVDLGSLHVDWYEWHMEGGPRPDLLRAAVTYYVTGAERWRHAETLEAITSQKVAFNLKSTGNPIDIFHSGSLEAASGPSGGPDHYVYDPLDVSLAELEASIGLSDWVVNQQLVFASAGKHLVYHSPPFERDREVSGFFRFTAWIAIDQPDTDFRASIYEIDREGGSILLSTDSKRARYREGLRRSRLVETRDPLPYDFGGFSFISRLIRKGNRLRLVLAPINSIFSQKNFNGGGEVAAESSREARPVNVRLFHDTDHPSVLFVPFGVES